MCSKNTTYFSKKTTYLEQKDYLFLKKHYLFSKKHYLSEAKTLPDGLVFINNTFKKAVRISYLSVFFKNSFIYFYKRRENEKNK